MVTSASSSQATRETRQALTELGLHEDLLAESWRKQLRGAGGAIEQIIEGHGDPGAVRSARALAATAAAESALAARFEARLLALSVEELQVVSAELEVCFASLRGHGAEASIHLESAAEDLFDELRTELDDQGTDVQSRKLRAQERLAEDLVAAMRRYADRIEQLLLDLGEFACAAIGLPAGGLLPTRQSHVPPRPDLHNVAGGEAAELLAELSLVAGRSLDVFRDRLTGQVEEAIETLEDRIDRAVHCHTLGSHAVRERTDELAGIARRMTDLASAMDWIPLDDG